MTYPGTVAWSFRNVTRSFDFWMRLSDLSISDGRPEQLATLTGVVVDEDASLTFVNEDEIVAKFDATKVFGGSLIVAGEAYLSEVGPRIWNLSAQDYTAWLDDSVLDGTPAENKRPSESCADRLTWLATYDIRGLDWSMVDPPDDTCDAYDFGTGASLRDGLDNLAQDMRCSYYVDNDKAVHFFRGDESNPAPFGLDNVSPDYSTTFPFRDYQRNPDSTDFHDKTYVQPKDNADAAYVTDFTWSGAHGVDHQARVISDDTLTTDNQRDHAGQRDLDQYDSPVITGSLTCLQPGLIAGQLCHINPALWPDAEADYILTSITITAVEPHDSDTGKAQMRAAVEFKDKRGHRTGVADTLNTVVRRRDTKTGGETDKTATVDDCGGSSGTATPIEAQQTTASGFAFSSSALADIESAVRENTAWPLCGCPVGPGGWGPGTAEKEQWYLIWSSGSLDAGAIGIRVTVGTIGSEQGVAGLYIPGFGVGDPTAIRQYIPCGPTMDNTGGSFFIPCNYVSAGLYFVLAPGWHCQEDFFACDDDLTGGDPGTVGPVGLGDGNSGTAIGPGIINWTAVCITEAGRADWLPGSGAIDGSNRTFTLIGWTGTGTVEARVGAIILGDGDFTVDPDAGTVTLAQAPVYGDIVGFRYDAAP